MNTIDERNLRCQWDEQGYIVVRGLIDRERTERLRETNERVLKQFLNLDPETDQPGDPNAKVLRHLNNSVYYRDDRPGLVELLELAADPQTLLRVVRASTGFDPLFRALCLFFNPASCNDDGNWHRDTQFMASTDEAEKQIIRAKSEIMQLQIALAPTEDSEYVPASHRRWDTAEEYHIRKADNEANRFSNAMPGALRVHLEPGDAVAFNSKGLHRGRYHIDKQRRTLMATYSSFEHPYRDRFHVQPWFLESDYLDGLSPHARRFYEKFIATLDPHLTAPVGAAR